MVVMGVRISWGDDGDGVLLEQLVLVVLGHVLDVGDVVERVAPVVADEAAGDPDPGGGVVGAAEPALHREALLAVLLGVRLEVAGQLHVGRGDELPRAHPDELLLGVAGDLRHRPVRLEDPARVVLGDDDDPGRGLLEAVRQRWVSSHSASSASTSLVTSRATER
jgi:hypothetical protein